MACHENDCKEICDVKNKNLGIDIAIFQLQVTDLLHYSIHMFATKFQIANNKM